MTANAKIGKLVVIGVGLIGGSFALALKKKRAVRHVVGIGRTRRNLALAQRRGIIDETAADARRALRDADLVFLGTPVGQMPSVLASIAPHLEARTLVTDGGSTKQNVIAHARSILGAGFSRFVPAHPVAGTEMSGAAAAQPDLYRDRTVILTPQPETSRTALRVVKALWEVCGARIVRLGAREHDEILAAVSHLPHVAAFALVNALAARSNARELFGYSGGGLRDTVRIAGSSPEMWRDICIANRDALLAAVDGYTAEMQRIRAAIAGGEEETLTALFEKARTARSRWLLRKGR